MSIDMKKIVRQVLVKFPSFGHSLANIKMCPTDQVETAGIDGSTMYYNPSFMESLTEKQQAFTISHEICHKELRHIERSIGKNPILWNIATDAVINAYLQQAGLEMIPGCVEIPNAYNMRAEDLYQNLLEEAQGKDNPSPKQQGEKQEEGEQEQNGEGLGNDENTVEQQNKESESGTSTLTEEQENEMKEKYGEGHTKHQDWQEKAKCMETGGNKAEDEIDDRDVFAKNQEEKKKRQEQLRKNMVKESLKGVGQEVSSSSYEISDVEEQEAILDWKKILKASLAGNQYDYRLSKRVRNGVIPYELKKLPEPCTEILLDTSGSISETLLRNFLSECMSLLKTSRIKVGCFDTRFYGFHEIRSKKDIQNMKIEGRGGTDFDVAVNAFSPSAENKIVFTDGCADTPQKNCKATWVIFQESRYSSLDQMNPPGGTKVLIPYEQYKKLSSRSYGTKECNDYNR